jgi:alkanesulfonate monooxygenase SsuD/methylene tetrahydromethanopterin reductase-like flavin-dependent oxidoreductase (luciferase family)
MYAAATTEEANRLFTSVQQQFIALRRGTPGPLKPPVEDIHSLASDAELGAADHALREAIIGDPEQVTQGISAFIKRTAVDEIMFSAHIYDHQSRLDCLRFAARACDAISSRD